jgi:uncharacterized membrane protein HdeD (DUF308 family)
MKVANNLWGWFLAFGIALVALGIVAIAHAAASTIVSVIFLGTILAITGVVFIFDSFRSSFGKWNEFFMRLGMGILYLLAGIILLKGPVVGSITLTLILAIMYIALGFIRTIYSATHAGPGRGWSLASGLITLLLGILILLEWPASGLFIIGLFIGIDLVFTGWIYIMAAIAAKNLRL